MANILYEMTISDELTDGVMDISLVDSPAIQEDFILLSENYKTYIELKLEKLADKLDGAEFSEMAELIIKENDQRIKINEIKNNFNVEDNENEIKTFAQADKIQQELLKGGK